MKRRRRGSYSQYNAKKRRLSPLERKQVQRIANKDREKKTHIGYAQEVAVSDTWGIYHLTGIAQGDTHTTRDGDEIKITSFSSRGNVMCADATNIVRITIISWKPNSIPAANDIFQTADTINQGGLYSELNHANKKNIRVHYDKILHMTLQNNAVQYWACKFKELPKCVYNPGLTTGTNQLYICIASDSSAVTHPTFTYRGELDYHDC